MGCNVRVTESHGVTERESRRKRIASLGSNRWHSHRPGEAPYSEPRDSDACHLPLLLISFDSTLTDRKKRTTSGRVPMAPSKLSSPKSRGFHARAILGPKLHDRLPDVKVLIVGAGGIGCELRMPAYPVTPNPFPS
jgi:hypothetical protein